MARAKAGHWAEGGGCGEPGSLEPFPAPCSVPPSLLPRGILKVGHTYYPGSQAVTGGCLKVTA